MTRVTLEDIARKAGVHRTTVSLALRNSPSLPEPTRQRLQELAREMGYRPDPALSALMAYRHQKQPLANRPPLAYVTNWDTRYGWKEWRAHAAFYDGALAKANSMGYNLAHFWMGEPKITPQRISAILQARGITGVIIASHLKDSEAVLAMDWPRFSGVKIDYFPREPKLHHVTNDHRTMMQLVTRQTSAAGYQRVGLVMPEWLDLFLDMTWSAGLLAHQQALPTESRIPVLRYVAHGVAPGLTADRTQQGGAVPTALFQRWLEQYRPDVIISKDEFVRAALDELGLKVPRDVAFVEMYLNPDGNTAGIRHNCDRVGELAVELLIGQMHQNIYGIPRYPTCTLVEGTWFDGTSLPDRTKLNLLVGG